MLTRESGTRYEGEFKDDKMDGKGIYSWPSGNSFEGEFKNGLMHGHGVKKFANGKVQKGQWVENKFTK